MAEFFSNQFTRITSSGTWTEVLGSNKGLAGFASGDNAEADVLIQNWSGSLNTVLVAVTSSSSAPNADTEAFYTAELLDNGFVELKAVLTGTEHLWVKSDQTDTRVNVSGVKEDN